MVSTRYGSGGVALFLISSLQVFSIFSVGLADNAPHICEDPIHDLYDHNEVKALFDISGKNEELATCHFLVGEFPNPDSMKTCCTDDILRQFREESRNEFQEHQHFLHIIVFAPLESLLRTVKESEGICGVGSRLQAVVQLLSIFHLAGEELLNGLKESECRRCFREHAIDGALFFHPHEKVLENLLEETQFILASREDRACEWESRIDVPSLDFRTKRGRQIDEFNMKRKRKDLFLVRSGTQIYRYLTAFVTPILIVKSELEAWQTFPNSADIDFQNEHTMSPNAGESWKTCRVEFASASVSVEKYQVAVFLPQKMKSEFVPAALNVANDWRIVEENTPEEDPIMGFTKVVVEVADVKQFTRQKPHLCPQIGSQCHWLRYPGVSVLDAMHFGEVQEALHDDIWQHRFEVNSGIFMGKCGFWSVFEDYAEEHRLWRLEHLKVGHTPPSTSASFTQKSSLRGAIVYVCYNVPYCGGHGDRFHGIVSLFLAAVVLKRAFFIDSRLPIPLGKLFDPGLIDWRVRAEDLNFGRRIYMVGAEDMAENIIFQCLQQADDKNYTDGEDDDEIFLLGWNARTHFPLMRFFPDSGLPTNWSHQAWQLLFKQNIVIQRRLNDWSVNPREFLGLHFRAGNESSTFEDPSRHGLSELKKFLDCAELVEANLVRKKLFNPSWPWFLASDTKIVWEDPIVKEYMRRGGRGEKNDTTTTTITEGDDLIGKLRPLSIRDKEKQITHLDRTPTWFNVNSGAIDSWAEYIALSQAQVLIISNSFFGETAAELGNVPFVFYADGCFQVHL